jgi:DNA-binding CsgD family transcriptional regulator
MAALIDLNLVRLLDPGSDPPRYAMLETVRAFAVARLGVSDDEPRIRAAHAAWCLSLAERGVAPWVDPPLAWLTQIADELLNLRAGFDWLMAQADAARALRSATAIATYCYMRGSLMDGRSRLTRALALAGDRFPELRAPALWCLSLIADLQQEAPTTVAAAQEALALFRAQDDAAGVAHSLWILGCGVERTGDRERARALYEAAAALGPGRRLPLAMLGALAYHMCEDERAERLLQESSRLAQACDDAWTGGFATEMLARVALRQGEIARAATRFRRALALVRTVGVLVNVARCLEGAAALSAATGRVAQTARWLGAAEALHARIDLPIEPADRAAYDRLVATGPAMLGDAAWAAAWRAGGALAEDVAMAEAEAFLAMLEARPEARRPSRPTASPHPPPQSWSPQPGAAQLTRDPAGLAPSRLTRREQEILELLSQRLTDQEIAGRLFISPKTVGHHVSNILGKLSAANRRDAAARAVRHGLI